MTFVSELHVPERSIPGKIRSLSCEYYLQCPDTQSSGAKCPGDQISGTQSHGTGACILHNIETKLKHTHLRLPKKGYFGG
jgi:hypothetical protein